MKHFALLLASCALAAHSSVVTAAPNFEQELTMVIRDYDSAMYGTMDKDAKAKALEAVTSRAASLAMQYPNRAEVLVWQGMSQAELSATSGSLSLVKQARKTLETAVAITPNSYAVDAYSTLGGVYANVPGFPLAFGDKKVARTYFQKALAINSSNIGANLGYAKLLFKTGDYAGAIKHATAALNGSPRPRREKADKTARISAEDLIAKAKENLR